MNALINLFLEVVGPPKLYALHVEVFNHIVELRIPISAAIFGPAKAYFDDLTATALNFNKCRLEG